MLCGLRNSFIFRPSYSSQDLRVTFTEEAMVTQVWQTLWLPQTSLVKHAGCQVSSLSSFSVFSSSWAGNVSLLSCAFCSGRLPAVAKIKTRSQFFKGCSSDFSSDQNDIEQQQIWTFFWLFKCLKRSSSMATTPDTQELKLNKEGCKYV